MVCQCLYFQGSDFLLIAVFETHECLYMQSSWGWSPAKPLAACKLQAKHKGWKGSGQGGSCFQISWAPVLFWSSCEGIKHLISKCLQNVKGHIDSNDSWSSSKELWRSVFINFINEIIMLNKLSFFFQWVSPPLSGVVLRGITTSWWWSCWDRVLKTSSTFVQGSLVSRQCCYLLTKW